ncbi:branched-subunit amino acid transport protein AzlD [Microbacterium sp. AG790]|uniref:AzlD domain-containing protein n=1 Tax=Microbacterium sp. AG790 TaxID=2183995 RepID=UPI000EAFA6CE|nr:AzlD domain-containing protein [Microbacterium sp. AG790]RKS85376.1 branched-subunit amino acid transport protein AzlD [Microbacterium sp. AG790]
MTTWTAVLAASFVCLALKALGYAIPARWFGSARAERSIDLLTVALLAALVAVQTLGAGPQIVADARVPAIVVAAGLLMLRAPFLIVVIAAALVAAVLRALGWAT